MTAVVKLYRLSTVYNNFGIMRPVARCESKMSFAKSALVNAMAQETKSACVPHGNGSDVSHARTPLCYKQLHHNRKGKVSHRKERWDTSSPFPLDKEPDSSWGIRTSPQTQRGELDAAGMAHRSNNTISTLLYEAKIAQDVRRSGLLLMDKQKDRHDLVRLIDVAKQAIAAGCYMPGLISKLLGDLEIDRAKNEKGFKLIYGGINCSNELRCGLGHVQRLRDAAHGSPYSMLCRDCDNDLIGHTQLLSLQGPHAHPAPRHAVQAHSHRAIPPFRHPLEALPQGRRCA